MIISQLSEIPSSSPLRRMTRFLAHHATSRTNRSTTPQMASSRRYFHHFFLPSAAYKTLRPLRYTADVVAMLAAAMANEDVSAVYTAATAALEFRNRPLLDSV